MSKDKQQFLFGEADRVYSTLSRWLNYVKNEIKAVKKKIKKAEGELSDLVNQQKEIEDSMKALVKK